MTKTLLSLGHGYSAQALARRLIPQGWHIIGTTRDAQGMARLQAQGVEPLLWPGTSLLPALARATHILSSIAPVTGGDPVLQDCAADFAAAPAVWAGYLSTTGVYGDHAGGWVTEDTPLTPGTERGRIRVIAERQWQSLGLPIHIFRLAGIYGPGRGPFETVRDGTAHHFLVVSASVHISGIQEGNSQIKGTMDSCDGLIFVGGSVKLRHTHAAQANLKNLRASRAQLSCLTHRFLLSGIR